MFSSEFSSLSLAAEGALSSSISTLSMNRLSVIVYAFAMNSFHRNRTVSAAVSATAAKDPTPPCERNP